MNKAYTCRICLEEENNCKNLVSPCQCKGTQKYIHKECLKRMTEYWIKCPTCSTTFPPSLKKIFELVCICILDMPIIITAIIAYFLPLVQPNQNNVLIIRLLILVSILSLFCIYLVKVNEVNDITDLK